MNGLRHLKVLNITTNVLETLFSEHAGGGEEVLKACEGVCTLRILYAGHEFIHIMPLFLKILEKTCPKLEIVYVLKSTFSGERRGATISGGCDSVTDAIKGFEIARPLVVIDALKKFVEQWSFRMNSHETEGNNS